MRSTTLKTAVVAPMPTRQRGDHRKREHPVAAEAAQRIAHILRHGAHPPAGPLLIGLLPRRAPRRQTRSAPAGALRLPHHARGYVLSPRTARCESAVPRRVRFVACAKHETSAAVKNSFIVRKPSMERSERARGLPRSPNARDRAAPSLFIPQCLHRFHLHRRARRNQRSDKCHEASNSATTI